MISLRKIEGACEQNTVFMAIGGGARPSYGQIVKFVREVGQANSFQKPQTLIKADAGYFSDANVQALHRLGIPALIADTMMRQRDQRFRDTARFRVLFKQSQMQTQPRQ
jgi:hypothetical protein